MPAAPLVLLDLDGTLIDSAPGITATLTSTFRDAGLPVPPLAALRTFIGPPLPESLLRHGVPPERLDELMDAYRTEFAATGQFDMKVFDGIPELLADLRTAGARLVIATAKPEVRAVPICAGVGLLPLVDGLFGAPADESEPKSAIVARALASVPDADLSRTLMVGDREHDVDGARSNGLDCVGVSWGYSGPGELAEAGAVDVVDTPAALRETLARRLGLPEPVRSR